MEIYYMYTKTRKDFGRHARFDDEPSEVRALRSRVHVLQSMSFVGQSKREQQIKISLLPLPSSSLL
jgi:hypothetical protein